MSHLNAALLNLIRCAEADAYQLAGYRRDHAQLTPDQHQHAAVLAAGLGMQFEHLARLAAEHHAAGAAAMWHSTATRFFDAAVLDDLAADLAEVTAEQVRAV